MRRATLLNWPLLRLQARHCAVEDAITTALGGIGKLVLAQRLLLGLYGLGWLGTMLLTRLAIPACLPDVVE
jgi:hypothetical protein